MIKKRPKSLATIKSKLGNQNFRQKMEIFHVAKDILDSRLRQIMDINGLSGEERLRLFEIYCFGSEDIIVEAKRIKEYLDND